MSLAERGLEFVEEKRCTCAKDNLENRAGCDQSWGTEVS